MIKKYQMTKKINTTPLEETEQQAFVIWLDSQISKGADIIYSAIPNSTFTTSWNQKRKNQATGVRAGLPDMFLIVANMPLFIEMKRKQGGVVSKEQKVWIQKINETTGVKAYLARGFEQAQSIVKGVQMAAIMNENEKSKTGKTKIINNFVRSKTINN